MPVRCFIAAPPSAPPPNAGGFGAFALASGVDVVAPAAAAPTPSFAAEGTRTGTRRVRRSLTGCPSVASPTCNDSGLAVVLASSASRPSPLHGGPNDPPALVFPGPAVPRGGCGVVVRPAARRGARPQHGAPVRVLPTSNAYESAAHTDGAVCAAASPPATGEDPLIGPGSPPTVSRKAHAAHPPLP